MFTGTAYEIFETGSTEVMKEKEHRLKTCSFQFFL